MNDNVRRLLKETVDNGVKEKENKKKLAALQKRIKDNNKILYLEIYQQLIEQFKEKSNDPEERLELNLRFKSYEFADKSDKEVIELLYSHDRVGIGIYNSPHEGEILIDAKNVQAELLEDGFYECPSGSFVGEDIKYKFAGWNDDERLNDNTLSIMISVRRLRSIMEKFARQSSSLDNRIK